MPGDFAFVLQGVQRLKQFAAARNQVHFAELVNLAVQAEKRYLFLKFLHFRLPMPSLASFLRRARAGIAAVIVSRGAVFVLLFEGLVRRLWFRIEQFHDPVDLVAAFVRVHVLLEAGAHGIEQVVLVCRFLFFINRLAGKPAQEPSLVLGEAPGLEHDTNAFLAAGHLALPKVLHRGRFADQVNRTNLNDAMNDKDAVNRFPFALSIVRHSEDAESTLDILANTRRHGVRFEEVQIPIDAVFLPVDRMQAPERIFIVARGGAFFGMVEKDLAAFIEPHGISPCFG